MINLVENMKNEEKKNSKRITLNEREIELIKSLLVKVKPGDKLNSFIAFGILRKLLR